MHFAPERPEATQFQPVTAVWGSGSTAARYSIFSLEQLQTQILIWNLPMLNVDFYNI